MKKSISILVLLLVLTSCGGAPTFVDQKVTRNSRVPVILSDSTVWEQAKVARISDRTMYVHLDDSKETYEVGASVPVSVFFGFLLLGFLLGVVVDIIINNSLK